MAYLFVCGNNGLNSKKAHYYHPDYPENLDKKYDSIFIEHKIKLLEDKNEKDKVEEEEEENDKPKPHDSYCDYVVYDLDKINLLYIAKILIP